MGTTELLMIPRLASVEDRRLTTGCTDEAVVLLLGAQVSLVMFTPAQARALAATLLELADAVDGGRGVS